MAKVVGETINQAKKDRKKNKRSQNRVRHLGTKRLSQKIIITFT